MRDWRPSPCCWRFYGRPAGRKISREALIEQYRLEDSRFIEVDGVELHVRDIGSGPVVLLLHGHAGNLRMWSAWTDALSDAYRVISFDIPGYGLTSPDPSGDYSLDRTADLAPSD